MPSLPCTSTLHPAPFELRILGNGLFYSSSSPYSHTAEGVSTAVKNYASLLPYWPTNQQQQALVRYDRMRNETITNFENHDLLEDLLRDYLHVFDDLFFFGVLGSYCDIRVVDWIDSDIIGSAEHFRTRGVSGGHDCTFKATIQILDRSGERRTMTPHEQLDEYLGTLLHEALHAIFICYVCTRHNLCDLNSRSGLGTGGHGTCWREAAEEIEEATARLNLGRSNRGLKIIDG